MPNFGTKITQDHAKIANMNMHDASRILVKNLMRSCKVFQRRFLHVPFKIYAIYMHDSFKILWKKVQVTCMVLKDVPKIL